MCLFPSIFGTSVSIFSSAASNDGAAISGFPMRDAAFDVAAVQRQSRSMHVVLLATVMSSSRLGRLIFIIPIFDKKNI